MNWAAGTQCVTKRHHGKPKPGELAYQKGEIVTVVDFSTVLWVQRDFRRRNLMFRIPFFEHLTEYLNCSFLEEGLLQGQTQHHRRGGTHKHGPRVWKTCSACGSKPQPHAVRHLFLFLSLECASLLSHVCRIQTSSCGCSVTLTRRNISFYL